jgi:iron(II)-dependent oxidoreductase
MPTMSAPCTASSCATSGWTPPVTTRQFAAFRDARGLRSPEGEDCYDWDDADARIHRVGGGWAADRGYEGHPAVEASWSGACDHCRWRGRRLPTEAEWEKVAWGEDQRRYPSGEMPPRPPSEQCTAAATPPRRPWMAARPAPVPGASTICSVTRASGRPASTVPPPYRPDDGREPARRDAPRVVRGASHDDPAASLRVTIRHHYEHRGTARGHHHVGFRCATSEDLGGR